MSVVTGGLHPPHDILYTVGSSAPYGNFACNYWAVPVASISGAGLIEINATGPWRLKKVKRPMKTVWPIVARFEAQAV